MDRRSFVRTVGAAGAAAMLPFDRDLHAADKLDKIGLQLYTVRKEMAVSVERTLADVASIGYREVEFAGYFKRPPRALRQLLDRNDLSAPAAHIGMDVIRGAWNRSLADAADVGHKWLVIASIDQADRNTLDAIRRTADTLRKAAEDAKQYRIRLAYHNHEVEFRDVEGRRMFDVLLENTGPEVLDVELDLYWITKAGGDPMAYFAKWPGRFPMVHIKDAGPAPDFQMRDVGKGNIDFKAIFAKRKAAGIKHFFVEHDEPADAMASVRASYMYLRALKF